MRKFIVVGLILFVVASGGFTSGFSELINGGFRFKTTVDFNRTLGKKFGVQLLFSSHLFNWFNFSAGLSASLNHFVGDGFFIDVGTRLQDFLPVSLNLRFQGKRFIESQTMANSIIPYAGFYLPFGLGLNLGVNIRFLNNDPYKQWSIFEYSSSIRELLLYYDIYYILSLERWKLYCLLSINNHDEFYAGNLGTIGYSFRATWYEFDLIRLTAGFTVRPTGSIALSATYYRFIIEIGGAVSL